MRGGEAFENSASGMHFERCVEIKAARKKRLYSEKKSLKYNRKIRILQHFFCQNI